MDDAYLIQHFGFAPNPHGPILPLDEGINRMNNYDKALGRMYALRIVVGLLLMLAFLVVLVFAQVYRDGQFCEIVYAMGGGAILVACLVYYFTWIVSRADEPGLYWNPQGEKGRISVRKWQKSIEPKTPSRITPLQ